MQRIVRMTVLACLVAPPTCFAVPATAIDDVVRVAYLTGKTLVVKGGDDVLRRIDDVTGVSGSVLREALEGVGDIRLFATVARARFPAEVGEKTIYRLSRVADDLERVPGAKDVMRLLVADNRANVKGALGELEMVAILLRRKDVVVTGMREIAETAAGKTDIDILFTYKGIPVNLERKAIDRLSLTPELQAKLDKMAALAESRGSVPILAAGEIPPTGAVLDYAASKGVTVTYGGYLDQFRMAQEKLDGVALVAKASIR